MGQADPGLDSFGKARHFQRRIRNAEHQGRQFDVGGIPLKQVVDLTAKKDVARRRARGIPKQALEIAFEAGTIAGKIEQVGVLEQGQRLIPTNDAQLGDQSGYDRSRQVDGETGRSADVKPLGGIVVEPGERIDVDDALPRGNERIDLTIGILAEVETSQCQDKPSVDAGIRLINKKKHREAGGAVFDVKRRATGRAPHRARPAPAAGRMPPGPRRARLAGREGFQMLLENRSRGRGLIFLVPVLEIGIDKDFQNVGLGQQP